MQDFINRDGYRVTDTHVFFYKKWLSNFGPTRFKWRCCFEVPGGTDLGEHEFFCTEQAFMWAKAVFFGDFDVADRILAEKKSPMTCKSLGRKVRNFQEYRWSEARYGIMLSVNLAKYRQDEKLKARLMDPDFDGKEFVEASPTDRTWGVGMDLSDDLITDPKNWKGRNLLGQVLTEVRDTIRLDGMLKVRDLVEHLRKYDQDACILACEPNAFDGGMWQPVPAGSVGLFVTSVSEDKKRALDACTDPEKALEDYKYAKDTDVIVRF